MIAIYVVDYPPSDNLPPLDDLIYQDGDGRDCGGFAIVGSVPVSPTCIVWVDTDPATHEAMANNDRYLLLEVQ
jgi:hypothetical protein